MSSGQKSSPMSVGLTGGIASGKSIVADMFNDLGVTIIDTDVIARDVVEPGQPALAEIREQFGAGVIGADGRLDRKALRAIVFTEEDQRGILEAILHPRIRQEAAIQVTGASGPYHIIVVPLLVESPMRSDMERILVVDCGEETQLARLLERDAETVEQARRMIDAQASRDDRLAIADDMIGNDGDIEATREQVSVLHSRYLALARNRVLRHD